MVTSKPIEETSLELNSFPPSFIMEVFHTHLSHMAINHISLVGLVMESSLNLNFTALEIAIDK